MISMRWVLSAGEGEARLPTVCTRVYPIPTILCSLYAIYAYCVMLYDVSRLKILCVYTMLYAICKLFRVFSLLCVYRPEKKVNDFVGLDKTFRL